MKQIVILLFCLGWSIGAYSQDITGRWNGAINVQGTQLRLVLNITESDNIYSATLDSPDQGAKGIPVSSITFENSILEFKITAAGIQYNGVLEGEQFVGTFKQSAKEFLLNLSREEVVKEVLKRPQEPKAPYPYYTKEVSFKNDSADIRLFGTLSLPSENGKFPVVILISGSGAQNRDQELFGHKPFLVIADYLTRKGLGVLRFDERGVGESEGEFNTATTADFASDVESAVGFLKTLKQVDKNNIGLIGHSEGGIIAPIVAQKSDDVDFIVLLAATGVPGEQLLLDQQELILRAKGVPELQLKGILEKNREVFELIAKSTDDQTLKADLTILLEKTLEDNQSSNIPNGMTKEQFIEAQINQIASPWMQYFIKFDPATVLKQVNCPVLAVNGAKDLQVPAKKNLKAIRDALREGGNNKVTTVQYPNLNHLFQECQSGLPLEYATIQQTFSPTVLSEISDWILAQVE